MLPRTLLVLVLAPLCLGMIGRAPADGGRHLPGQPRPAPVKVYPVALRYRQQLYQRISLPAPPAPAPAPDVRPAGGLPGRPVERLPSRAFGALLLSLLARLQT